MHCRQHTPRTYSISPTETHATAPVPLWNLNGSPGLLFEVRGKLRAHSGEVRWAFSCLSLVDFHPSWSSFPGEKVDPADESVLHAALREANEEVGIDVDKIETLGGLGSPTRSLSGLRVWPYMVSSVVLELSRQMTLAKAFLHEEPYSPRHRPYFHLPCHPWHYPKSRSLLSSISLSIVSQTSLFPRTPVRQLHPVLGIQRYRPRGA